MAFYLSVSSKQKLAGVNPDLVRVVQRAIQITEIDFRVTEGLRSYERQVALVKAGASKTLKSRHLTGHAVDLVALVNNEARWDWPLYSKLADAMKKSAEELGVKIVWGGDWTTFKDGPHFELA